MCYRTAYMERRNETKPIRTDNAREKVWSSWHPAFEEQEDHTSARPYGLTRMTVTCVSAHIRRKQLQQHSDTPTWLHESFLYLPLLCCWASKFSHCLSLFQHCLTVILHLLFPISISDILPSFSLSPYFYLPFLPSTSLILSMFYSSPLMLFFLFPYLPPLLLQKKFPG